MNKEYSYRPEYEYRDEYPAPPEEYGSQSRPVRSKRKKLAQLMLYSWITLMIGGGTLAASAADTQCAVTVYDTGGNVILEETVSASELEALSVPNGTYLVSESGDELVITEGCLGSDVSESVSPAEDGMKHIELRPAA